MNKQDFDQTCYRIGVVPLSVQHLQSGKWNYLSSNQGFSESVVDTQYLDTQVIITLAGETPERGLSFAYIRATGVDVARLFKAMREGIRFRPQDYGVIVTWGYGTPALWVKDQMRSTFGLMEVPPL